MSNPFFTGKSRSEGLNRSRAPYKATTKPPADCEAYFLALPPEIRLEIYEYLIPTRDDVIDMYPGTMKPVFSNERAMLNAKRFDCQLWIMQLRMELERMKLAAYAMAKPDPDETSFLQHIAHHERRKKSLSVFRIEDYNNAVQQRTVLQVNKQIRVESLPLFYKREFQVPHGTWQKFLSSLDGQARVLARRASPRPRVNISKLYSVDRWNVLVREHAEGMARYRSHMKKERDEWRACEDSDV